MLRRRRRGFTIQVTVSGDEAGRTFTLPLNNGNGSTFDCIVDWGDGTRSTVTAYDDADRAHTYAADGTYDVEIRGTCEGWSFNNGGDKLKVTRILFWGDRPTFGGFKYLVGAFYGCANCTSLGYGKIPVSGAGPTSLTNAFRQAKFSGPLPAGFLDHCTDVTDLYSCFAYNQFSGPLPAGFLDHCTGVTNLYACFYNNQFSGPLPAGFLDHCTGVTNLGACFHNNQFSGQLPTGFLDHCTDVTDLGSCFARNQFSGQLPTGFLDHCTDVTNLNSCFAYNQFSGQLPTGFLDHCTDVTNLGYCFAYNQFSGPLPAGFLDHCTDVTNLNSCFATNQFSGQLPTGFLDHCTDVTDLGSCFATNQFSGSLPAGFLDHCTAVKYLYACFYDNQFSGQLPTGFLDHCTDVTNLNSCFATNQFSGQLPTGFLDHCTDVTNLAYCFYNNQFSGPLPAGFLDHCTDVTNLYACFYGNNQLQLSEYCCYADGEQATRFLGKTMNFASMFARSGAYTGAQGTAPDLWNCDFGETITLDVAPAVDWAGGDTITGQTSGATAVVVAKVSALVYKIKKHFGVFSLDEIVGVTGVADKLADQGAANPTFSGTPVSAGCFSGHGISTVSNYADIPASWK